MEGLEVSGGSGAALYTCWFRNWNVAPLMPPVDQTSPPTRPVLKKPASCPWRAGAGSGSAAGATILAVGAGSVWAIFGCAAFGCATFGAAGCVTAGAAGLAAMTRGAG